MQLNKCLVVFGSIFQTEHSDDGWFSSMILFTYEGRVGDLFKSWARVRRVSMGSSVSERCKLSGMVCFRLLRYVRIPIFIVIDDQNPAKKRTLIVRI